MPTLKRVKVLRTVLVADETIYGRQIDAGTVDCVPLALFDALAAEGYVEDAQIESAAAKIVAAADADMSEDGALSIERVVEDRAEPYRRKRK